MLLANVLRERGAGEVFLDFSIRLGENFVQRIHEGIAGSDVVLVLIGRPWLGTAGQDGRPRIKDELDLVHVEVRSALARGVPVVPVLIDGAVMPQSRELPEALRDLAYRQAAIFVTDHWQRDAEWLADRLIGNRSAQIPVGAGTGQVPSARDESRCDVPRAARTGEDVIVVVARRAYGEYLESAAYVCQPGRSFRGGVERMAFYFDRLLRREVPLVLHVRDEVPWFRGHADALRERGQAFDREIAALIDRAYDAASVYYSTRPNDRWERFKVFLLTPPDDARTLLLPQALWQGGGSAFTMNQRYVSSERLRTAATTDDL